MKLRHLAPLIAVATLAAGLTTSNAQMSEKNPYPAPVPPVEEVCLSYDFFDIQYIYTSFDHLDDGHGVGFNLSKGLFDNVYGTLALDWSGSSVHGDNVDLWGASGGLGYAIPLSPRFHLNIEGGGTYGSIDGPEYYNSDNWGFYVGPGLRYCISPGTEFFANVYYVYYDGGYDTFETNVGFVAAITENLGFKVAGLLNEDDQSVLVGIRVFY